MSESEIQLSWADNSGDESGFRVERSPDGSTGWALVAEVGVNAISYMDSGLQSGTSYFYRVKAFNGAGESGTSNTASATTGEPPPTTAEIHAGDLDGVSALAKKGRWNAIVTITVHDGEEDPVPGATVSGAWSAGASGTGTCVTNSAGTCSLGKSGLRSNVLSVTFSVTGISLEGAVYMPAQNHDPEGDSNGTAIVVQAP
jgi:hypothetical protein